MRNVHSPVEAIAFHCSIILRPLAFSNENDRLRRVGLAQGDNPGHEGGACSSEM